MSILRHTSSPVNPDPRSSWPDWADSDRWVPSDADGPRPTAGPDFEPTDEDLAEAAGFELGRAGEPAPDVADLSVTTAVYLARARGHVAGRGRRAYALEMERLREIDADHDEIMGRDARFEAWIRHMEATEGVGEGPEYA
jgi:hypothetical protein